MTEYMYLAAKGRRAGWYPEERAWKIALSMPQAHVKAIAGPFKLEHIENTNKEYVSRGQRPVPIFTS